MMHRRTLGLTALALAASPLRNAHAIIMTCGGGGWEDEPGYWPRTTLAPVVANILAARITRLDAGQQRRPTVDQICTYIATIFPQLVEQGFARMSQKRMAAYFRLSSDSALAKLATMYRTDLAAQSRVGNVLPMLAVRADDASLRRVIKAFGTYPVYEALSRYAPTRLATFEATARGLVVAEPPLNQTAFTPNIDMTIPRIFSGFRLAPTGATSIAASLYQTAAYVAPRLIPAGVVSYTLTNTYITPLIAEHLPSLYDAIGGTISGVVDNLGGLLGIPLSQAQESATYDFQITDYASLLEQTGGDFGVVEEWSVAAGYGGGGC